MAVVILTLLLLAAVVGLVPSTVVVADTVAALSAVFDGAVAVAVDVTAVVTVTLMITHKRESSPTFMINPAGFLMTKLPRWLPVVLGATKSTEISAV